MFVRLKSSVKVNAAGEVRVEGHRTDLEYVYIELYSSLFSDGSHWGSYTVQDLEAILKEARKVERAVKAASSDWYAPDVR